jgi:glycosidase
LQIEDHFFKHKLTADQMTKRLTDQLMKYRDSTNAAMMNMLDSHDTARILTVANGDQDLALQALTFEFVQKGSPCIYYGTEMGMTGGNDPDCRKPMDWSKEDGPVWQRVHELIKFRLDHDETFGKGTIKLHVTENGLIEVDRNGMESVKAYFNTTDHDVKIDCKDSFSQDYQNGVLAPKGFVITVD